MSRRKRNWIIIAVYAANVIGVFLLLFLGELNSSVSLFFAIYLVILTSVVSYMLAHGKKLKK